MKDKNIMEQSDEEELYFKMLQELIYLGNSVWDHNWNWTVTKQEIDYSEEKDGMFEVAVASFVNIVIKPTGLERQNMGYGYSSSSSKSMAYFLARKISIVNALQETLLSFNESITDKIQSYKLKEKCATTVFPTSSNTMVEASHNIRSENLENKNTNTNKNNVLQRSHNSMINSLKTITSNVRIPTEITTAKPNLTAVLNKPSCTSNINFNKPSKSSDHPTAATSTAIYPQPNQQTTPNRTEVANQMHALNNIRSGNVPTNPFHSNNAQAQTAIFNQNTVQPVRPVLQHNINNVKTPVTGVPAVEASKSEEEARAKRRQRQKEKQEEFQRLHLQKLASTNSNLIPNPNPIADLGDGGEYIGIEDASILISTQDMLRAVDGADEQATSKLKRSTELEIDNGNKRRHSGYRMLQFL